MRTPILVCAAMALVISSYASPARADESAQQQLEDAQQSSNDAANAPSDEDAKDLSNQGFDTPNTDPAPEPQSSDSSDQPGENN